MDVLGLASTSDKATLLAGLTALAERIARNRELAGLHYASDSDAGKTLAGAVHGLLSPRPVYMAAVAAAQGEWS